MSNKNSKLKTYYGIAEPVCLSPRYLGISIDTHEEKRSNVEKPLRLPLLNVHSNTSPSIQSKPTTLSNDKQNENGNYSLNKISRNPEILTTDRSRRRMQLFLSPFTTVSEPLPSTPISSKSGKSERKSSIIPPFSKNLNEVSEYVLDGEPPIFNRQDMNDPRRYFRNYIWPEKKKNIAIDVIGNEYKYHYYQWRPTWGQISKEIKDKAHEAPF